MQAPFLALPPQTYGPNSTREQLQGFRDPLVYLVGSYEDAGGHGREVCSLLLDKLASSPQHFDLQLFCCGKLNTGARGEPLATSLAYDTVTGSLNPGQDQLSPRSKRPTMRASWKPCKEDWPRVCFFDLKLDPNG